MASKIGNVKYVPGRYEKKRPTGQQLAGKYFRDLNKKRIEKNRIEKKPEIYPTICFSRKIGVGALEIADILAEKIDYEVVDRELLEYIAQEAKLSQKTVEYFDERYPGVLNEFAKLLFGEKSFIKSDFNRHLFNVVLSIAGLKPTLFVGRGTHLIIPRDRVLAVRFICSDEHRINRLSRILKVKKKGAADKLLQIDKEQSRFFKKAFGKKDAVPYEFDMVINRDHIDNAHDAAEIVELAFKKKFAEELS
ncbi:MAG TPA: cytidylate kinase-like family protein [Desulfobacterales bacterium]|nr:cytidylate kinase-like family protein [Desulfobacterales bacterium]